MMDERRLSRHEALRRRNKLKKEMDPEDKAKLLKVTPQLFGEFLDTKGGSRRCLACGSHDLFVPVSMTNNPDKPMTNLDPAGLGTMENMYNGTMIAYVTFTAIDTNESYSIQNLQYCVTCQNSAFISAYRVRPVINWVFGNNENEVVE